MVHIKTGDVAADVQEHCRFGPGDLFGERALLMGAPRAATITAISRVEAWTLSRNKFERLLGSFKQLQQVQYLADPRKLIGDFHIITISLLHVQI